MYIQAYTLYSSVRPFGVSTIVGGVDVNGPQLYIIEPSGISYVRALHSVYVISLLLNVSGLSRGGCW